MLPPEAGCEQTDAAPTGSDPATTHSGAFHTGIAGRAPGDYPLVRSGYPQSHKPRRRAKEAAVVSDYADLLTSDCAGLRGALALGLTRLVSLRALAARAEFRGHSAHLVHLGPGFLGRTTRPETGSRHFGNALFPSGRPVRGLPNREEIV